MSDEIYKQIEVTEYEFYYIVQWLIENNVNFRHPSRSYSDEDKHIPKIRSWDTGLVYRDALFFKTPEDYIAFKLRWL